jgi:hypothetical protein
MIAITTSSSINVNADRRPERRFDMGFLRKSDQNGEAGTPVLKKTGFIITCRFSAIQYRIEKY